MHYHPSVCFFVGTSSAFGGQTRGGTSSTVDGQTRGGTPLAVVGQMICVYFIPFPSHFILSLAPHRGFQFGPHPPVSGVHGPLPTSIVHFQRAKLEVHNVPTPQGVRSSARRLALTVV